MRSTLNSRRLPLLSVVLLLAGSCLAAFAAPTVRIKDIAAVQGVRENQLLGLGLVTGLSGKGDSSNSALLRSTIWSTMSTCPVLHRPADRVTAVRSRASDYS